MVHFSYQRYIENNLREQYGFIGTPLRLRFREGEQDDDRYRRGTGKGDKKRK